MTTSGSRSQSQAFIDAIPVVPYADIRAAHDFLVDVVGLDSGGLVEREGSVVHGEVRAGDRRFWLHKAAGGLSTPAVANVANGRHRASRARRRRGLRAHEGRGSHDPPRADRRGLRPT